MPYEDEEPPFVEPDFELDALAQAVIGAALAVHRHFGPGLDEGIYHNSLAIEMRRRGVAFVTQPLVEVVYQGEPVGKKRLDFIVGGRLVIELKAVDQLSPVHRAQLRTYLKITHCKLGLLINFNEIILKHGLARVINPSVQ